MSKKPVFDLDALEAEATGEPFVFKFGGAQFIVPAIVDLTVSAHLRRGDWSGAIERLLGPVQWAALEALPAVFTLEHARALVEGFTAHLGTDPGKSPRSRSSSRNGAKS